MGTDIVPPDSRYIPFTQQPACCVPTCFQMVMYRHSFPLIPAEEIGFYLGLTVHPDRAQLFYNVRTSKEKPPAGYGTRIYDLEYEPNVFFRKFNIPLAFTFNPITKFNSPDDITDYLNKAESEDKDVLLCFQHGALINDPEKDWGHVCVFDRLIDGKIRMIDPSPDYSKWRLIEVDKMFEAMKKHGEKRSAGFWELTVIN